METPVDHSQYFAYIKKNTKAFSLETYPKTKKTKPVKKTKAALKLETLIHGNFGCYEKQILALVSEITGEKIETKTPTATHVKLGHFPAIALVVNKNYDSHDYQLGQVVLKRVAGDRAYRADGSLGNHLDGPKEYMRAATDKEIQSLTAAQMQSFISDHNIIFV